MRAISFSLFGDEPKYFKGAIANLELAKSIYPGWRCVFYVENPECETAEELRSGGATVFGPVAGVGGYYWRHCIVDMMEGLEYYIVRDCDSRVSARERSAVDEWIDSGKAFHLMRDHPKHMAKVMQGMYGVKGYALAGLTKKLEGIPNVRCGPDEMFAEVYATIMASDCLEHGEFNMDMFPNQKPFPVERDGVRFVGEILNADGTPETEDWKIFADEPKP